MGGEGRVSRDWQGLVKEWRASGLPVSKFCRYKGIAPSSFWYWQKRFASKEGSKRLPIFLPVCLTPKAGERSQKENGDGGFIEILIAGRYPVRVAGEFAPAVLDSVVTVLERRVC